MSRPIGLVMVALLVWVPIVPTVEAQIPNCYIVNGMYFPADDPPYVNDPRFRLLRDYDGFYCIPESAPVVDIGEATVPAVVDQYRALAGTACALVYCPQLPMSTVMDLVRLVLDVAVLVLGWVGDRNFFEPLYNATVACFSSPGLCVQEMGLVLSACLQSVYWCVS